jgi:hypothetical protein
MKYNYKEKVLEVLHNSALPMDIENIRIKADIKNWTTSKAVLLELLNEGKINGQMTTRSWIFWAKKSGPNPENESQIQVSWGCESGK